MKVFLTHGIFDLVTPYFAAERISRLMKLSDEARKNLTLKWYPGGHMFYTRNDSRRKFFEDMKSFYSE
jgi:carboxypeptidase C (cathepsin A)